MCYVEKIGITLLGVRRLSCKNDSEGSSRLEVERV